MNRERDATYRWLDSLKEVVREHIPSDGTAISEYQLIRKLSAPPCHFFDPEALRSPETAFYVHFPLFHALYQLRSEWRERSEELEIHALCIRRVPRPTEKIERITQEPGGHDRLAAYYLNLENLFVTSPDMVRDMVDRFWEQLGGAVSQTEREQAARTLGIDIDSSREEIRRAYRRHAQRAHPDRGGNTDEFIAIQTAFEQLMTLA